MKKILIITSLVLVAVLAAAFYAYKKVIPEMTAKAIVKGEYSVFIPKKVESKISIVRDTVNRKIDEVVMIADSEGITIEQLIAGLEEVDKNEVMAAYRDVKKNNLSAPEEIFDSAYKNIKIEAFDPLLLKPAFVKHIQRDHVDKVMHFVEKNNIMENLEMNMYRNIAKQVLYEKQDELRQKVEVIE
ncbi:hypothetical protein E1176_15760 [Fulvivirga sp. RKSG066]|uniref:hypothetical protein n=1 Tax=Fulvivirga aurantia TaxID=2529383 RepID=UPI0012BD1FB4|nr:hypothetical protein [Fulvivirga aurantia]MTI22488.1 hypothetical protein [Fulvivirga aurantia]